MILFCRYGVDPSAPEKGYVFADYPDGAAPPADAHPDCLAVPDAGPVERFGRFGPAPDLMGDAPASHHASQAELDAQDVAKDSPLRAIAGNAITKDNRRPATDFRHWAAPDLTVDVARAAKLREVEVADAAAQIGGFPSSALGAPHTYPSDADALGKMQMAAIAALSGQSKPAWTAALRCVDADGVAAGRPHKAAQVHQVVGDFQAFSDALQAKRDDLAAQIAAAADVAAALAITWA
jgi:hypothetical protein